MVVLFVFLVSLVLGLAQQRAKPFSLAPGNYRIHAYDIVFRETPFSQFAAAGIADQSVIGVHSHFAFDYNSKNQLVRVQKIKNGMLDSHSGRWLIAPVTEISYNGDKENHIYFNEYGSRTIANGNVYRSEFQLKEGKRQSLRYFDINGKRIANLFAITDYRWHLESDSVLIEERFDREKKAAELRPQIDFYTTRFVFHDNALLNYMENWDLQSNRSVANSAGIHRIKISYDQRNYFANWINLDAHGNKRIGSTGVAEISYTHNQKGEEKRAEFFDGKSQPIARWGIYQMAYRHDQFGNVIETLYLDKAGEKSVRTDGIASRRYEWSADGAYQLRMTTVDRSGNEINHPRLAYSVYRREISDFLIRDFFLDADQRR
ncbi:MAG: hypothetical protein KDD94_12560, partial [Calditrichaeota bacterium]|nr:hypothetical protein [Calditrichota bacterium]